MADKDRSRNVTTGDSSSRGRSDTDVTRGQSTDDRSHAKGGTLSEAARISERFRAIR
jgi:hypothetical protein